MNADASEDDGDEDHSREDCCGVRLESRDVRNRRWAVYRGCRSESVRNSSHPHEQVRAPRRRMLSEDSSFSATYAVPQRLQTAAIRLASLMVGRLVYRWLEHLQ